MLTQATFADLQQAALEQEVTVWPARSWAPSQLGHPCDRFLVFRWTKWEQQARHDYVLQSIFRQGREYQELIYDRLKAMGLDLVRESDRPSQYRVKPGLIISGRPDGKIVGIRGQRFPQPLVLEIKALGGHTWDRLDTIEDVARSSLHYIRGYHAQAQLYTFLENLEGGVLILQNKSTGLLKALPYRLDLDYCESLLRRVEALQPFVESATDPPPIPWSADVCGRCPFEAICYPARDFGEGAAVLTDSDFLESLEARETLRRAHEEYLAVDRSVKAYLKHEGIKTAIAGAWAIECHERETRGYTVEARTDSYYTIRRLPEEPKESAS